MTTVLQARPRQFVSTPSIERIANRALRYLQSGFSIHLRGPAGTGKTTLALHLADLVSRPIMLMFGDDEFKTSDLIGNQTGFTRKKVVDNYIHSVVKIEDELRHNWVDSRLTLACREGFTLVYDEFNRSRPEVNNVLLSALEEKLLVLPPSNNRSEYIRVNSHFRAILTSNPEEYCGVHDTQDALLDRLITINIPEPDELTQQEIVIQKTGSDRDSVALIVHLVKSFRTRIGAENSSGLRACLILAKICHEHEILVMPENAEFREICQDVLLSRAGIPLDDATRILWDLFNEMIGADSLLSLQLEQSVQRRSDSSFPQVVSPVEPSQSDVSIHSDLEAVPVVASEAETPTLAPATPAEWVAAEQVEEPAMTAIDPVLDIESPALVEGLPYEQEICGYLEQHSEARMTDIEQALGIRRSQALIVLKAMTDKGLVSHQGGYGKFSTYRRTTGNLV